MTKKFGGSSKTYSRAKKTCDEKRTPPSSKTKFFEDGGVQNISRIKIYRTLIKNKTQYRLDLIYRTSLKSLNAFTEELYLKILLAYTLNGSGAMLPTRLKYFNYPFISVIYSTSPEPDAFCRRLRQALRHLRCMPCIPRPMRRVY